MIYLVHWKDMVDLDFLDEFIQIAKAVYFAEKAIDGMDNYQRRLKEVEKRFGSEVFFRFKHTLKKLSFSGYEEDGKVIRRYGWFAPYVDPKGHLKFLTTAPPNRRKYISREEFESWLEEKFLEQMEESKKWEEKSVA